MVVLTWSQKSERPKKPTKKTKTGGYLLVVCHHRCYCFLLRRGAKPPYVRVRTAEFKDTRSKCFWALGSAAATQQQYNVVKDASSSCCDAFIHLFLLSCRAVRIVRLGKMISASSRKHSGQTQCTVYTPPSLPPSHACLAFSKEPNVVR